MQAVLLFAEINWAPFVWCSLGLLGLVGFVALVSPTRFAAIATRGNTWVDSQKFLAVLDRKVDVDHLVLPFSRWLGLAVLTAAAFLATLYWRS